jgi:aminoglycoside phosphotransferase (APT) family kinase protein
MGAAVFPSEPRTPAGRRRPEADPNSSPLAATRAVVLLREIRTTFLAYIFWRRYRASFLWHVYSVTDRGAFYAPGSMADANPRSRGCCRRHCTPGRLRAVPTRMHEDEIDVDESLVRSLLASQLPDLADLPLAIVEPWGTDNAIWRLGDDLVVRLPRIHWATGQVSREAMWLPRIAPHLAVAVPEPIAIGEPGCGYPYCWAVHRWLPGDGATLSGIDDALTFATDLAEVVQALQTLPVDGAPPAANRARPLQEYYDSALLSIEYAANLIDAESARAVWEEALAAPPHHGPPVWVHGDLEGNCILRYGRLSGLVDWGSACAGDPAVDVQVVWSELFTADSRRVFLDALDVDDATVARSRGAAIQQACAALPYYLHSYPLIVERSWHKLAALGVEPRRPS